MEFPAFSGLILTMRAWFASAEVSKVEEDREDANDGGGQSGDVAKDRSQVPAVLKATEPVSAGTVWRTRSDPFESVWPEVKEILKRSPTVKTAVFDHLASAEGAFQQGQSRTPQRRIKQWKAEYGEAKEVMFPQKYRRDIKRNRTSRLWGASE